MNVKVNRINNDSTDFPYPCLLEKIPDYLMSHGDIIFANLLYEGFVQGFVLTNQTNLSAYVIGTFLGCYTKDKFRLYHGEVKLSN